MNIDFCLVICYLLTVLDMLGKKSLFLIEIEIYILEEDFVGCVRALRPAQQLRSYGDWEDFVF